MRFKRMMIVAAMVGIAGTTLSACQDGRPGHNSDRHHRGDQDRDHHRR